MPRTKQPAPQAADPPIGSEPRNGQSLAKEPDTVERLAAAGRTIAGVLGIDVDDEPRDPDVQAAIDRGADEDWMDAAAANALFVPKGSETTIRLEANGKTIVDGMGLAELGKGAAQAVIGKAIAQEFAAAGQGDAAPAQAKLPGEEWRTPPLWPPFEGHEIERVTLALSGSLGLYGGNEFDRSLAARLAGSARFHLLLRVRCDRLGHVVIRDSKTGADLGREGTAKLAILDVVEESHLADRLFAANEQIGAALEYIDNITDAEDVLSAVERRRMTRIRSLLALGPQLTDDLEAKIRETAHEHAERAGRGLTDLCECGEQRIDHDEDGHCEAFACKCRSFRPLMSGRTDVNTVTGEILTPAPEGGAPC